MSVRSGWRGCREPPPVTQLHVTRAGVARLRWQYATLADLLEASAHTKPATKTTGGRNGVFVYFHARLTAQPALVRAQAAVRATKTPATSATP